MATQINVYKRKLRSHTTPEQRENDKKKSKLEKEAKENRPFITYPGQLIYHTEFADCAMALDNLLEEAKKCQDLMIVGFDMEWPFSFQTGPGRTAVLQISPNLKICYILQVSRLKQLPKALSEFLEHPNVRLTGNNIKNDVRKLARDFVGFNADKIIENCIDTGVFANSILPVTQRWSLEKLVNYCLNLRINKDKKVRMSKWHIIPLSEAQQRYAAIDAYASLKLYYVLKEKELKNQEEVEKNNESTEEFPDIINSSLF